jgi:hypothetical protein
MFRALYPDIGTMIPEGQARHMALVLASNHLKTFEVFMKESLKAKDSRPPPKLCFLASVISCDYIIYPSEMDGNILKEGLKSISLDATNQVNLSAKYCHSEFIVDYFDKYFGTSNHPDLFCK